jgi:hypothetical protein
MAQLGRCRVPRKISLPPSEDCESRSARMPASVERLTVMPSRHDQGRWVPASSQGIAYVARILQLLGDEFDDGTFLSERLVSVCQQRGVEVLFLPYSLE